MKSGGFEKHKIVFFLVPNFSMIAFATAIEALRLANRFLPEPAYEWCLVSSNGKTERASNNLSMNVDGSLDEVRRGLVGPTRPEMILVCSGLQVERFFNPQLAGWLRQMHEEGVFIGGLCTGAWVLAQAGLLANKSCAIHWEELPTFSEQFPDAEVHADLFEIDDNIYTCAGGTAALDMMLHIIGKHFGSEIQNRICEQALIDHTRSPSDRQRMPLRARLGIHNTKLLFIIELMEANLAEPLPLTELSQYTNLSRRQIERLFAKYLGRSPARYYLDLRLERARHLLLQSDMPVIEVAIACGFVSASHFSKCYREFYNRSPHSDRMENLTKSGS